MEIILFRRALPIAITKMGIFLMIHMKTSCGSTLLFYLPNCSCFCKRANAGMVALEKEQLDKKAIGPKFISDAALYMFSPFRFGKYTSWPHPILFHCPTTSHFHHNQQICGKRKRLSLKCKMYVCLLPTRTILWKHVVQKVQIQTQIHKYNENDKSKKM